MQTKSADFEATIVLYDCVSGPTYLSKSKQNQVISFKFYSFCEFAYIVAYTTTYLIILGNIVKNS